MQADVQKATSERQLFERLDTELSDQIDEKFFADPKEFRSLVEVVELVGQKVGQAKSESGAESAADTLLNLKHRNPAYNRLLNQRKIAAAVIEEVVMLQHGGLNNCLDTMNEVTKEYHKGREEIRTLRKALSETQTDLITNRSGQVSLRDLVFTQLELAHSLKIAKELDFLKNTTHRVQRLMQQRRYLSATLQLQRSIESMFNEDVIAVPALCDVREQLLSLKESLVDCCVRELQDVIVGSQAIGQSSNKNSNGGNTNGNSNSNGNSNGNRSASNADADNAADGTGAYHYASTQRSFQSLWGDVGRSGDVEASAMQQLMETIRATSGPARPCLGPGTQVMLIDDAADEDLEDSIKSPWTAENEFLYLLVRALGALKCDENIIQMLLEGVHKSFRALVLQAHQASVGMSHRVESRRHHSLSATSAQPADRANSSMTEDILPAVGHLAGVLDASVHILQRAMFVVECLKEEALLRRRQKQHNSSVAAAGTTSSKGQGHSAGAPAVAAALSGSLSAQCSEEELNQFERTDRLVLTAWGAVEDVIVEELEVQLEYNGNRKLRDEASDSNLFEDDGGLRSSVNRASMAFGANAKVGAVTGAEIEPSRGCRFCALLYESVVLHSLFVGRVVGRGAAKGSFGFATTWTKRAKEGAPPDGHVWSSKVLALCRWFVDQNVIPVLQSVVSHVLRGMHARLASATGPGMGPVFVGAGTGTAVGRDSKRSSLIVHPSVVSFMSTVRPFFEDAVKLLMFYWVRLMHHRDVMAAIFDRAFTEYAAIASEETAAATKTIVPCMEVAAQVFHQTGDDQTSGKAARATSRHRRDEDEEEDEDEDGDGDGDGGSESGNGVRKINVALWHALWFERDNATQHVRAIQRCETFLESYAHYFDTLAAVHTGCSWTSDECSRLFERVVQHVAQSTALSQVAPASITPFADEAVQSSVGGTSDERPRLLGTLAEGTSKLTSLINESMMQMQRGVDVACHYYVVKLVKVASLSIARHCMGGKEAGKGGDKSARNGIRSPLSSATASSAVFCGGEMGEEEENVLAQFNDFVITYQQLVEAVLAQQQSLSTDVSSSSNQRVSSVSSHNQGGGLSARRASRRASLGAGGQSAGGRNRMSMGSLRSNMGDAADITQGLFADGDLVGGLLLSLCLLVPAIFKECISSVFAGHMPNSVLRPQQQPGPAARKPGLDFPSGPVRTIAPSSSSSDEDANARWTFLSLSLSTTAGSTSASVSTSYSAGAPESSRDTTNSISHMYPPYISIGDSNISGQWLKTRLLGIVVAVEQGLSLVVQSMHIDAEIKTRLLQLLFREFSRTRQHVVVVSKDVVGK